MYKFVRIRTKNTNDSLGYWYFVPKDIKQIREHFDKYCGPIIKDGIAQIVKHGVEGIIGHYTNQFAYLIDVLAKSSGYSYQEAVIRVESDVWIPRLTAALDGKIQYLTDNMSVLIFVESQHEITEEFDSDILLYPHEKCPSEDDIKILKCPGGIHYYAKIGKEDVIWENNQKWDSEIEAIAAAKHYLVYHYSKIKPLE